MLSDENIDLLLMAKITNVWQKVALVIGKTMMEIDAEDRIGLNDLYFSERVANLIEKGLVEYDGDTTNMRRCEIRLPDYVPTPLQ